MSRYKLLGEIWDNRKSKKYRTKQNVDLTKVLLYNNGTKRDKKVKINLSEILDASDESMSEIIKQLNKFETIYVQLDCKPKIDNEVVQTFFDKRLRQINYVLSRSLSCEANVFFVN